MKTVKVKTSLSTYPVIVGSSFINSLPIHLTKAKLHKRIFVLIDETVHNLYGSKISKLLNRWAEKFYYYKVSATEKSKSITEVIKLYSCLLENNFGRDTLLIAIGGGVVGDLSGFVASTYMRGIQLVLIPTTLLSVVDSSIGGKTGVNFSTAKNILGTYYQPSLVLIDSNFLKTLPKDELLNGMGEVIKYGYLAGTQFYSFVYSNFSSILKLNQDLLNKIILDSVKIKAAVVEKDEFEKGGLRKILNFGHTFAHAYESFFNFKIHHGNAVSAGIVSALLLSYKKELINKTKLNYFLQLPLLLKGRKIIAGFNSEDIVDLMKYDKKSKNGKARFVLIKDFGEMLTDVPAKKSEIIFALNETKKLLV